MAEIANTKVLNCVYKQVSEASFKAKTKPAITEEFINEFLDSIIKFRSILSEQTKLLLDINESIEKITWIDEPLSNNDLQTINDIISSLKDMYSSLNRQIFTLKGIKDHGIATECINEFRSEVEDLKDSYQNLESVFFFLPNMEEFQEAEEMISLL